MMAGATLLTTSITSTPPHSECAEPSKDGRSGAQSRTRLPPASARWPRNMNFKALRAFQLIAERGSLSAAASDLCLSQPAVSRLIAMLEGELALRLFNRTGRGLSMTREGKLFYDTTKHILAGIEDLPRIARDIRGGDQQFHLLTTARIAQAVISPALSRLRKETDRIRVRVDVLSHQDIDEHIAMGGFDLAIATLPLASAHLPVETSPLFKVRIDAVLPAGHPLTARDVLTAADLANADLIGPWHDPLWRLQLGDLLPPAGASASAMVETPSSLLACQMASDGVGIAFMDRLSARGLDSDAVEFRPLSPAKWLTFGYVHPRGRPLSPHATAFVNSVRQTIGEFRNKNSDNANSVFPDDHELGDKISKST
jgi:DNA-binding transcriptional LysR family regulator